MTEETAQTIAVLQSTVDSLRAENAALRERLAAAEKAFADAERDRMADIQAAVRQERARVDEELARLRAEIEPTINGLRWHGEYRRGLCVALDAIDASRARLGGGA